MQEAEFHLSIYHYFVWKERQATAAATATTQEGPPTAPYNTAGGGGQQPPAPNTADGDKKLEAKKQGPPPDPGDKTTGAAPAAEKNAAMAEAMLHHFPQHLAHFKDSPALQNTIPPIISTLYIDFPALQTHNISTRARIAHLESMLARTTLEMNEAKQRASAAFAEASAVSINKKKRGKKNTDDEIETASNKKMRISDRVDIPEDIKELINELRTNAHKQKAAGKKRIDRLEARIQKEREDKKEVAKKAARIAVETVQCLHPKLIDGSDKTESAKAGVAAATAGTTTAATSSKPKPPPEPSPWKTTATFEERLEELEHFRKGNGHCRVPLRQAGLGRWVGEMRTLYKKVQEGEKSSMLTDDRIAKLNEMGFTWMATGKTVPWEQRYEELKVFKEKFGHCSVPRTSYKDNPSLGEFVHMQRKLYRQKAPLIMGEREQKLNELGFVWETGVAKPSFEERLEECREFRRKNGHLDIPLPTKNNKGDQSNCESKEVRSFYSWAQRQREEYRKFNANVKSSLDRFRIKKLTDMGFAWELKMRGDDPGGRPREYRPGKPKNEDRFKERVQQLRDIRDRYGDFNDLKTLKLAGFDETSTLYQWIKAQRKQYKSLKAGQWSSLTEERHAMLENIKFNFEPRKHYAAYGSKSKSSLRSSKGGVDNEDDMRKVVHEATDELDGEDMLSEEGNEDDNNYDHQVHDPRSYRI